MKIDLEWMLNLIQGQMSDVINAPENYDIYEGTRIICSLEQQFMKLRDFDPRAIYIVVKFGSTSVVFGQSVLPVSIVALSEENKLEVARSLLMQYALTYNLKRVNDEKIQQIYEAPSVVSNFEPVYAGFRSIITESGVFVVSVNVNFFKFMYYFNREVSQQDLYTYTEQEQNRYYMHYRAGGQTYKAGSYYVHDGEYIVSANSKPTIYEEVDLYRYVWSATPQGTYFKQTPTYPITFENGGIYYFDGEEYIPLDLSALLYYTEGVTDFATPNPTQDGYYRYTGDSGSLRIAGDDQHPVNMYFVKNYVYYYKMGDSTPTYINVLCEETPSLSNAIAVVNSPDTQAFYNTDDFTETEIRFGAVSITMSTFMLNNSALINDTTDMFCKTKINSSLKMPVNAAFKVATVFKDGRARFASYKLANYGITQDIGQIPSLSLSFVE